MKMMDRIRGKKLKKNSIPSIQITLTTFSEDENGEISYTTTGIVKIDGENDSPKLPVLDCSIFKSAVVRNLLVLSFGQFLLFMAFNALSNLQSIMNVEGGIGTISLVVVYGAMAISSFFLPTVIIRYFKCKKTLVFATISFCPYILGNFYPTWSTLISTAIVCGLVSGPLWCARCTYLNQISHRYARLQNTSVEIMNAWFFSVCTTFQQNTEIWGNILAYYILKIAQGGDIRPSESVLENCGPDFCDDGNLMPNSNLYSATSDRKYILITILTALVLIAAFFTAFFLDTLESEETEETEEQKFSISDLLGALYQFSKIDQILLLPLSLYTGLVDGFYNGDFTKAYVACAWGIPHMGAVSICYGVVSALVDSACGPCIQILGRAGLFFLASIAHFAMFLALSMWKPNYENPSGFFLVAGAHGIGNGVWMSQIVALYGVLFKENEERAFSCFYFLNCLGFLLAYSYNTYLCTKVKLFIPMAVLVIGLICYSAVEVRMVKKSLLEYRGRVQENAAQIQQQNLTVTTYIE